MTHSLSQKLHIRSVIFILEDIWSYADLRLGHFLFRSIPFHSVPFLVLLNYLVSKAMLLDDDSVAILYWLLSAVSVVC